MRSQRAKDMYPDLESKTCAALSLARLAVEPLLEYCSLWKGVDSTSTFGFEAMFLKLHPLQVFEYLLQLASEKDRLYFAILTHVNTGTDQARKEEFSVFVGDEIIAGGQ